MAPELVLMPRPIRRLRFAAIIIAILVGLWLPLEDLSEWPVIVLVLIISTWVSIGFLIRKTSRHAGFLLYHPIVCLVSGLTFGPVRLGLMAIKTGLHGHSVPDFTPDQIQTVIALTPFIGVVGLFIGLGTGIVRKVLDKDAAQS